MSDLTREQVEAMADCPGTPCADCCALYVCATVPLPVARQLLATMTALEAAEAALSIGARIAATLEPGAVTMQVRGYPASEPTAEKVAEVRAAWLDAARQARESEPTDERGEG